MEPFHILARVEYDGTNYFGWQKQSGQITVQEVIEKALSTLLNEKTKIIGSGRTDTGVHAINQYFSFKTKRYLPDNAYLLGLNHFLPRDIRIKGIRYVDHDFHPIFSAKKKTYIYKVLNRKEPTALDIHRVWHVPFALNAYDMKKCAGYILGEHDFRSFRASADTRKNTVRLIYDARWEREGELLIFKITANGFLHNMVRILVGTMVEVGLGKITTEDFVLIKESKDRKKAGKTAPPQGLYLYEVYY
ncbi:MAG: tRNA pseudouridine(38-40) synthase TruA [Proteobacteria bacterium]|nr:tRNA pseudouridine(38-40) synthase TruA [Pseudomonadota bacterium]